MGVGQLKGITRLAQTLIGASLCQKKGVNAVQRSIFSHYQEPLGSPKVCIRNKVLWHRLDEINYQSTMDL